MNTSLKFFARAARGTDRHLEIELRRMGIHAKFQPSLKSFEFRACLPAMLDVCYKSRVIEQLDVQVGQKFQARDMQELTLGLQKVTFNSFWNVASLKLPTLKVKVQNSVMSSRIVEKIFKEHIGKLPVIREFNKMQIDVKGLSTLADVHSIIRNQIVSAQTQPDQKLLPNQSLVTTGSKELIVESPGEIEFKLIMDKNYGRIYTPVNAIPMYKHGWKKRVGWGPIKESIAAAVLESAGVIDQVRTGKRVKLWDPFCGSGTFLLQALSLVHQIPVRQNSKINFNFLKWPCFKQQYIDQYLASQPKSISTPISVIGSDISLQAINYTIENYKQLNLAKQMTSEDTINIDPYCNIFKADNSTYFVAEDFEKVGEKLLKGNGYTIIANPPYGIRSKQEMSMNQLMSLYRRFSDFISKNYERFEQVFVVVPIEDKYNPNHFLSVSKLQWSLVDRFYSGPTEIGLYGLADKTKSIVSSVSKVTLPSLKETTELEFPRSTPISAPPIHVTLPTHLIPKRPKNAKKRVLWRRQVQALRVSYERHVQKRYALQSIQAFKKDKMAFKLQKRGRVWKTQNLGILGGKPEDYEQGVRQLFDQRIVKAMERGEQVKKAKQVKKDKRNNVITHRKW